VNALDSSDWEPVGSVAPAALAEARLQLHHAVQVVSAVGATLLAPLPDDSHPNLGWEENHAALAGHSVPGEHPFRAALRLADAVLLLLDASSRVAAELALRGQTLDGATAWLGRAIEARGATLPRGGLRRPPYDLPDHPVAHGVPFPAAPAPAFAELAHWFGNAHRALAAVAARNEDAGAVRCWPHHFDIATLLTVERDAEGRASRTIGAGLSPGDESYGEPYFYVSPWPDPDPADLPPLSAGGHWHTQDFTAAILTRSELVAGAPAEPRQAASGQADRTRAFLDAAVEASRRALAG
jgi:hypothetical protein